MTTRSRIIAGMLTTIAVGLGALLLVTLWDDTAKDSGRSAGRVGTWLDIDAQVTRDGGLVTRRATLSCRAGGASATGALAGRAEQACDAVVANRDILVTTTNQQICTMIYGGPEVARITGYSEDRRISRQVTRSDGCGISDWDLLVDLLGDPTDTPGAQVGGLAPG